MTRTFEERFWSKVDKNGPVVPGLPSLGRCWIWTAFRNRHGYGQMSAGGRHEGRLLASRASWMIHRGDPGRSMVLHKCDRPACVNPDHLFLGTHVDNMRDMVSKNRGNPCGGNWLKGEDHPLAKLTVSRVLAIRSSTDSLGKCAAEHGVSKKLVLLIRQQKIWRHVA